MKAPIAVSFHMTGGKASWQSRTEHGERPVSGAAFYMPENALPEFTAVLARALLKAPGHKLPLLPSGEAALTVAGSVSLTLADGKTAQLTQYQLSGLDFSPTPVWLDAEGRSAALLTDWFAILDKSYAASIETLSKAQMEAQKAWFATQSKSLTHIPAGEVVIRHARLFDPRDLSVTPGMSVLVHNGHIVRVAQDADLKPSVSAEVVDARGRFMMPGLWDNHEHFADNDGALDLANGVTSARDMANDTDELLERCSSLRCRDGARSIMFAQDHIDGTGPLAGPTKMRVDTAAQALQDVDWYADHGYGQIKIYSSVKPEPDTVMACEFNRTRPAGWQALFRLSCQAQQVQLPLGPIVEIQTPELYCANFRLTCRKGHAGHGALYRRRRPRQRIDSGQAAGPGIYGLSGRRITPYSTRP